MSTNVGPKKLVIGVDQGQEDDAEEPLVVVVKGTRPTWVSYGNMFSVQGSAGMVKIPFFFKLLYYFSPLFWVSWKGKYFVLILVDDGLAHFWDEQCYGIVGNTEGILEALVAVPVII